MKHLLSLSFILSQCLAEEQCYDSVDHKCSCGPSVCDKAKCESSEFGIWSEQCSGDKCECEGEGATTAAAGTIFVDDNGVSHTIPQNAKIVTGIMDAVAFHHFGMDASNIIATIGERSTSGSNHGGFYYDGNIIYKELNHSLSEYDPSIFPADPNTEERAYLDSIPGDLSANCSSSNYYCDKVDVTYLNENGWPDFFIVGAFYDSLIKNFLNASIAENVSIIELKNSYEESGDIRNMIGMTERMEELAVALGVDVDSSVVNDDKKELCAAAKSFQATAQKAHDAGVRAMATYMPYIENGPGATGAFIPNPDRDPVLSMMQNLGLPLLFNEHDGNYWENRAGDYAVGSGNFLAENATSLSGIPYNVDFWLYDDRVSLDFLSEKFAEDWPHPALTAKQYAYWPSNARILSYRHAAEILTVVGESLESATRVSPASNCVEHTGDSQIRDLKPGEYSCVKIFPIDFCAEPDAETTGSSTEEKADEGPPITKVEWDFKEEPTKISDDVKEASDDLQEAKGEESAVGALAEDSSGVSLAVAPILVFFMVSAFVLL